jgi:CubicO group peptidase (beta-lactamase class C family)
VLQSFVSGLAEELDVPGVSVGVLHDGEEQYAYHGVTSIENPLPVDERTLFLCGSTTKTFTATAIVQLAARGDVDLAAPARRYVPELRVQDEDAAASVTVLQLLNHTAGWDGDFFKNTGEGEDALAGYVEAMAVLRQLTPPGEAISYNNASLAVAGRLIENVTGMTYEAAARELLLEPLGLDNSFFFPKELLVRRYAVDHHRLPDGGTRVLPHGFPRADNAIGGLATTPRDLIAWARFHLAEESVRHMQEPTFEAPGWSQGSGVGIGWLLSDPGGLRTVGHGGATLGQLSMFKLVPERGFALAAFTNAAPVGNAFNERVMDWAWKTVLDAPIVEPPSAQRDAEAVLPYCGRYETIANVMDVAAADGGFVVEAIDRPEVLEELGVELEQDPPVPFSFLAGHEDRFACTTPPHRGSNGFFIRDADGTVTAMNVFGRHCVRTGAAP